MKYEYYIDGKNVTRGEMLDALADEFGVAFAECGTIGAAFADYDSAYKILRAMKRGQAVFSGGKTFVARRKSK